MGERVRLIGEREELPFMIGERGPFMGERVRLIGERGTALYGGEIGERGTALYGGEG